MTRNGMLKRMVAAVAVPALGWLVPACLWGQVPAATGATLVAGTTATELEVRAEALFTDLDHVPEAGAMLEKAARLLAVEDANSVELLIRAGRLHYFSGDLVLSRRAFRDAGWRALGQGQPQVAANAYADAALVAVAQGDHQGVAELAAIVTLIEQWPGLSVSQRRQIRSRIQ